MSQAAPGSVLVIDRMGNDKIACAGEMPVMNAQALPASSWTAP